MVEAVLGGRSGGGVGELAVAAAAAGNYQFTPWLFRRPNQLVLLLAGRHEGYCSAPVVRAAAESKQQQ